MRNHCCWTANVIQLYFFGLLGRGTKNYTFFKADSRNQNHLTAIYSMHICWPVLSQRVNNSKVIIEMVFFYQNCSDLLWEKIVLVMEKNFWNSRLKAEAEFLMYFVFHWRIPRDILSVKKFTEAYEALL